MIILGLCFMVCGSVLTICGVLRGHTQDNADPLPEIEVIHDW